MLRRFCPSPALARATWQPCTEDRPLHVPPKLVTVPSCKVVLNPPHHHQRQPSLGPWRMAMHRCDCGHVVRGRRVRTLRCCGGSAQPRQRLHQHRGQTLVAQSVLAVSLHRAGASGRRSSDERSSVCTPKCNQIEHIPHTPARIPVHTMFSAHANLLADDIVSVTVRSTDGWARQQKRTLDPWGSGQQVALATISCTGAR